MWGFHGDRTRRHRPDGPANGLAVTLLIDLPIRDGRDRTGVDRGRAPGLPILPRDPRCTPRHDKVIEVAEVVANRPRHLLTPLPTRTSHRSQKVDTAPALDDGNVAERLVGLPKAAIDCARRAGKSGRRLRSACLPIRSNRVSEVSGVRAIHTTRAPRPLRTPAARRAHLPRRRSSSRDRRWSLLLIAAVAGLIFANSAWRSAYENLKDFVVGPASPALDLSLEDWAADGLLAIFFFVAGLELKRELVVGTLRERAKRSCPSLRRSAAWWSRHSSSCSRRRRAHGACGWAIPMATDIAFALAVLAVVGSHLPPALRAFLLTLAVVDDLGAITVIALFYTDYLRLLPLLVATVVLHRLLPVAAPPGHRPWIYIPLALRDLGPGP